MKRSDRLRFKTWRSWINVRDASFFFSHAIERVASYANVLTGSSRHSSPRGGGMIAWRTRKNVCVGGYRAWSNNVNATLSQSELIIECSSLLTERDNGVYNFRNRKTEEKIIQNRQKIRPKPKTSVTLKIGKPKKPHWIIKPKNRYYFLRKPKTGC